MTYGRPHLSFQYLYSPPFTLPLFGYYFHVIYFIFKIHIKHRQNEEREREREKGFLTCNENRIMRHVEITINYRPDQIMQAHGMLQRNFSS